MSFTPITENETAAISRLLERLSSYFSTDEDGVETETETVTPNTFRDIVLLRFLRGRDHVEDDAFDLLVDYAKWRKKYDVDDALSDSFSSRISTEEQKNKYVIVDKADLEDRPTAFVFVGRHNMYDRNVDEMRFLIIHVLERMVATAKPEEERIILALDMSQFGMSCMDYEVARILVDILKTYYPETLQYIFMVDSPWIFSACWAIIKQWLNPVTLKKVHFLKLADLKKYMKSNAIPKGFAELEDDNDDSEDEW